MQINASMREFFSETYINFLLSANIVFQPRYRIYSPIVVRSTYTFTAVIVFFKNCEFGDYPPIASAKVKAEGPSTAQGIILGSNYKTSGLKP